MNRNDPDPSSSDNPNPNGGGSVPPEARARMVKDALDSFYKKHDPSPVTPIQVLSHRAQLLHQQIWRRCQDRLKAMKDSEVPFNKSMECDQLFSDHIELFKSMDKEQLLYIFAQINAEFMTERAEDWYANL